MTVLGFWGSVALIIGIILETGLLLCKDFDYALEEFGKHETNIVKEVERYASKALTLATITFAAISFLLGQYKNRLDQIQDPLFLFVVGLSLFFISYKLEVFGPVKRIIWDIQQRLFNYGILSLVAGLSIFLLNSENLFIVPASFMLLGVFAIHIAEYVTDYRDFGRS